MDLLPVQLSAISLQVDIFPLFLDFLDTLYTKEFYLSDCIYKDVSGKQVLVLAYVVPFPMVCSCTDISETAFFSLHHLDG